MFALNILTSVEKCKKQNLKIYCKPSVIIIVFFHTSQTEEPSNGPI